MHRRLWISTSLIVPPGRVVGRERTSREDQNGRPPGAEMSLANLCTTCCGSVPVRLAGDLQSPWGMGGGVVKIMQHASSLLPEFALRATQRRDGSVTSYGCWASTHEVCSGMGRSVWVHVCGYLVVFSERPNRKWCGPEKLVATTTAH